MKGLLFTLGFYFIFIALGCSGCGGVKKPTSGSSNSSSDNESMEEEVTNTTINKADTSLQTWYEQNQQNKPISITRNAFGKEVKFNIDPIHPGGDGWTTTWEEKVDDPIFQRCNRICQLSPSVILYRRFPNEVAKDYYYTDQAEKIEFLDKEFKFIKTVDIWKNHPYQNIKDKLTYHHYDLESASVLPYSKQSKKTKPTEYSLFTYVKSEGNHVIVNYELRSMEVTKEFGSDHISLRVVGVKHTLHIYDLHGNLKYEIKDIPSVDGAVVSNNGEFMMYIFGGIGLATANSPFATIERSGWALMRLKDQKIVYQEYTDDGKLAFARLWLHYGYLKLSYSTPSAEIDYDYWVYFDEISNKIYKHNLTKDERDFLREKYKKTGKVDVKNQVTLFNFQQILINNK